MTNGTSALVLDKKAAGSLIPHPDLPLVLKRDLIYKESARNGCNAFRTVDFAAMRDSVIPVTLICHTGKADISVFRRSKYDIDLLRSLSEIQGGWMTTEHVRLTVFLRENPRKPLNKRSARLLYILRLHVTSLYFLVCEQIFLIFAIGTICFDVQKPNASCRASVRAVLV